MKLRELLKGCDSIKGEVTKEQSLDRDISGVAYDSRKVKKGCLFVAIKGDRHDGHDFISEAISKGAVAIVHEKEIPHNSLDNSSYVSFIRVEDSRRSLACIANNFYGMLSRTLTLIGVTGTNGKTTTTYILKSILESWGKEVGLIGTIQYMIKERVYPAPHTTPESLEFHGLLKDMLLAGCTHVVSEISSHALAQHRVDGAFFKVAVFTNLTRDHLDFHKTMEDYFRAKERLFRELLDSNGMCVINLDDPYGKRLISSLTETSPDFKEHILTYGIDESADIVAREIQGSHKELSFRISFRGRNHDVTSLLIGMPNVYNIMSAVGVSVSLGVPWQTILEGLRKIESVKGRFESVELGQTFSCIIDYAHTEDALERLISTAREFATHDSVFSNQQSLCRIITVFGCGGDRDRSKRPKMGEVATRLSDFVIITSDNPRSEEPGDIIREIETGAVRRNYIVEPDRKEAIKKAIDMAGDRDIVLIAGKGHEDYQEIEGKRYRFNDREIVEEAIKRKQRDQGDDEVIVNIQGKTW